MKSLLRLLTKAKNVTFQSHCKLQINTLNLSLLRILSTCQVSNRDRVGICQRGFNFT